MTSISCYYSSVHSHRASDDGVVWDRALTILQIASREPLKLCSMVSILHLSINLHLGLEIRRDLIHQIGLFARRLDSL